MPTLEYRLYRSSRRTLSVEVHPNLTTHVRAPNRVSLHNVESFLHSRLDWIVGRLVDLVNQHSTIPRPGTQQFLHRGRVFQWGTDGAVRKPTILVDSSESTPVLLVPKLSANNAQILVERWQRSEAERYFAHVLAQQLPAFGLAGLRFGTLRLRRMSRRWGSCSASGVVTLNDRLIQVPDVCIQSVIVHELCHLVHMHHGPSFYETMYQVMPEHRAADKLLDRWSGVVIPPRQNTNGVDRDPVHHRVIEVPARYAEVLAQISSNAVVSAEPMSSGVRPSM